MQEKQNRALFANQLRGVAVLAVILVHWGGIYWYARDTVASFIYAPAVTGAPSSIITLLTPPTVNYGALGVGIFFLISGFVIPFSLARATGIEFLFARMLRIYPTYFAGSAFMLLMVWLSSRYWGQAFSLDKSTLWANLMLIHKDVMKPSMDLINWTLSIEIKFYILAALMCRFFRSGSCEIFMLFAVVLLCFCEWYPLSKNILTIGHVTISIDSLKNDLMFVVYMLIGVGFYNVYVGNMSFKGLLVYGTVMFLIFSLLWSRGSAADQFPSIYINYLYALIVFTGCFLLRGKFRPWRPLDFMADISYPLYIIHSVSGYVMFRFLMDLGLPYKYCIPLVFCLIVLVAYAFHISVEQYTSHAGKKIFAWFRQRHATSAGRHLRDTDNR